YLSDLSTCAGMFSLSRSLLACCISLLVKDPEHDPLVITTRSTALQTSRSEKHDRSSRISVLARLKPRPKAKALQFPLTRSLNAITSGKEWAGTNSSYSPSRTPTYRR